MDLFWLCLQQNSGFPALLLLDLLCWILQKFRYFQHCTFKIFLRSPGKAYELIRGIVYGASESKIILKNLENDVKEMLYSGRR